MDTQNVVRCHPPRAGVRRSAQQAPLFVEQAGGDQVGNIGPFLHLDNGVVPPVRHAVVAVVFAVGDGEAGIQNDVLGWIQRIGIDERRIIFSGGVVPAGERDGLARPSRRASARPSYNASTTSLS
jgi:hypothetical protein